MKRSLALLPALVLGSLALVFPVASNAISQKSLAPIVKIVGSTAYSYPDGDRMRLQDLRTGRTQSIEVPARNGIFVGAMRANGAAVVFGNRFGVITPAELWFVKAGSSPKLLAIVPQTGTSWCDMFNAIRPLQLDKSDVTLAVTVRYGPVGNNCHPIADQSSLDLYRADGSSESIPLPYKYRAMLDNAVAARGTRILFRSFSRKHLSVFDYSTGRTIWEGNRPAGGEAIQMLSGNTIGTSFNSDTANRGWAERFNYKTGKTRRISFGTGVTEFCGRFVAQSTFKRLQIFDARGRQLYSRKSGKNSSFNAPICSDRFVKVSRWTSVKAGIGSWSYRLVDLRKLK